MWTKKKKILFLIYSLSAKHLPESRHLELAKKIRGAFAKHIVSYLGQDVNIEKGAFFTPGLSIGNRSGIGIDCEVHGDVKIGKNVMMGPEVVVYTQGHKFSDIDMPMIDQGTDESKPVIIEDNVWIGRRVIILPGVTIGEGCIIGAGAVVAKSIEPFSVAVGNPAKVVKNRKINSHEVK